MAIPRHQKMAFGLFLCLGTAPLNATAQEGVAMPQATAPQVDSPDAVDPDAVAAMQRMSAYLTSLKTIEIVSEGSIDVVTEDGQRVQLDGVTSYKVRYPGFVIDYVSDLKSRRFYYDGKQFTIYSPKLGFYATAPAPATNKEALNTLYRQYGISLPLVDLFRWSDPNGDRADKLTSGYKLGTATLGGIPTDHYVFREEGVDWEIWIQQGDQPLPRKLVIVDQSDPMRPTFIARLQWKVNPALADSEFTFVPDKDAKQIQLANYEESGE